MSASQAIANGWLAPALRALMANFTTCSTITCAHRPVKTPSASTLASGGTTASAAASPSGGIEEGARSAATTGCVGRPSGLPPGAQPEALPPRRTEPS
eukprot:CAMPEP_0183471376 /NCGR_PEP_ID=MMETSP0370-20130417/157794_1 /TAXON_ID=268820 /ORGANISM="Peridinium aciculiferum, Strain PAER-2" /LENGTH=97 /DNA_ID=CAMNT_0025663949 /DNA_START=204 /DNA_END=494 /DNA_ORIENTATION=-